MYIHELKDWPNFLWDQERLAELLIQLRHQQGRLIGRNGIHWLSCAG